MSMKTKKTPILLMNRLSSGASREKNMLNGFATMENIQFFKFPLWKKNS